MYLNFITRVKEGDCARSLVKCGLLEKENDYAFFLTGWTVGKEKVQGKVKQYFLCNVLLWKSLSLNLRKANTNKQWTNLENRKLHTAFQVLPRKPLDQWSLEAGKPWAAWTVLSSEFGLTVGSRLDHRPPGEVFQLELWYIPLSMPLVYTVSILAGIRKYEGYMDIWFELTWKTLRCVNKKKMVLHDPRDIKISSLQ